MFPMKGTEMKMVMMMVVTAMAVTVVMVMVVDMAWHSSTVSWLLCLVDSEFYSVMYGGFTTTLFGGTIVLLRYRQMRQPSQASQSGSRT